MKWVLGQIKAAKSGNEHFGITLAKEIESQAAKNGKKDVKTGREKASALSSEKKVLPSVPASGKTKGKKSPTKQVESIPIAAVPPTNVKPVSAGLMTAEAKPPSSNTHDFFVFNVNPAESLGLSLVRGTEESAYAATVKSVSKGKQAEAAGVETGMHVHNQQQYYS